MRELVTMMASLYPEPLPVDEALELAGIGPLAGRRTQKLSGGETQRVRFAVAIVADTGDGGFATIAKLLPSYWLVQASHVGLGGAAWGRTGWLVVGAWTVAMTVLAARAYRRDTERA